MASYGSWWCTTFYFYDIRGFKLNPQTNNNFNSFQRKSDGITSYATVKSQNIEGKKISNIMGLKQLGSVI